MSARRSVHGEDIFCALGDTSRPRLGIPLVGNATSRQRGWVGPVSDRPETAAAGQRAVPGLRPRPRPPTGNPGTRGFRIVNRWHRQRPHRAMPIETVGGEFRTAKEKLESLAKTDPKITAFLNAAKDK